MNLWKLVWGLVLLTLAVALAACGPYEGSGGGDPLLADVHAQAIVALERSGLWDDVGEDNITGNVDDALNRARVHLGLPQVERPPFATPTVRRETPAG